MSNHATTVRTSTVYVGKRPAHQSKAQRRQQRLSVGGVLLCLAVLAGGASAGKVWAQDTCAQGTDLGVACQIASR